MNKLTLIIAATALCASSGAMATSIGLVDAAAQAHDCIVKAAKGIKKDVLQAFRDQSSTSEAAASVSKYSTAATGITGATGMTASTADYAPYSVGGLYDSSCDNSLVDDLTAQFEIHREEGAGNIQYKVCLYSKGFAESIANTVDGTSQDGAGTGLNDRLAVEFGATDGSDDSGSFTLNDTSDCALSATDRVDAS